MTPDKIDKLEGRELDIEIHRRVFDTEIVGWGPAMRPEGDWTVHLGCGESSICVKEPLYVQYCICNLKNENNSVSYDIDNGVKLQGHSSGCLTVVPFYSTDPAAMMEVVEKMELLGWVFECGKMVPWPHPNGEKKAGTVTGWSASFKQFDISDGWTHAKPTGVSLCSTAFSAPLAVARAALKAVAAVK
jgi:hypothetical protein